MNNEDITVLKSLLSEIARTMARLLREAKRASEVLAAVEDREASTLPRALSRSYGRVSCPLRQQEDRTASAASARSMRFQ